MSTALLKRKLDISFRRLDTDGNGYAERADLQDVGARLIHGFGQSPTSPKGRPVVVRLDAVWAELAAYADGDRDGRLSSAEYRHGMTRAFIEGPAFDPVFHPAAEAVVHLCDTDGDGRVQRGEFEILQRAFSTPASAVVAAFDRLDTDGDGLVSTAELVTAIRAYYTGTDPAAPGNWLFGPL
ncbi:MULTISPECIES: EF-hand domain-containing protein [unclassified Streptomyces]|uniref:EF-hand domain-containing protein n=1 Tax=unclassified Streptomyces TaxID=2593676 RepID=UPI00381F0808